MYKTLKSEKGSMTLVEATIVFPIVFIVVFMMIVLGNIYYIHSRIQFEVVHAAIDAASAAENPMQVKILKDGGIPSDIGNKAAIKPYRHILSGHGSEVAQEMEDLLISRISKIKEYSIIKSIAPDTINPDVAYESSIIMSQIKVSYDYNIPMPIKYPFSNKTLKVHYYDEYTILVGDPAELVRNVSMIADEAERHKGIMDFLGKIGEVADKIGKFIN